MAMLGGNADVLVFAGALRVVRAPNRAGWVAVWLAVVLAGELNRADDLNGPGLREAVLLVDGGAGFNWADSLDGAGGRAAVVLRNRLSVEVLLAGTGGLGDGAVLDMNYGLSATHILLADNSDTGGTAIIGLRVESLVSNAVGVDVVYVGVELDVLLEGAIMLMVLAGNVAAIIPVLANHLANHLAAAVGSVTVIAATGTGHSVQVLEVTITATSLDEVRRARTVLHHHTLEAGAFGTIAAEAVGAEARFGEDLGAH